MTAREILKAFLESSHECLKVPGWAQWYSNFTICKGTLMLTLQMACCLRHFIGFISLCQIISFTFSNKNLTQSIIVCFSSTILIWPTCTKLEYHTILSVINYFIRPFSEIERCSTIFPNILVFLKTNIMIWM